MAAEAANDPVRFLLNGQAVSVRVGNPTRSLLQWLREDRGLTGTKEGCAEGDCGACTVVVGEWVDGRLQTRSVNACIQFLPMLDGKAVFTVEYLRGADGGLHPVQQAMVDCHASQCGFCTPGFVMSLWQVYLQHADAGARPDRRALARALAGNLCRCTGYRPILEAGERMFELPARALDRESLTRALASVRPDRTLRIDRVDGGFMAPRSLDELLRARAAHPQATLLAGATDIGLWVNKQLHQPGDILYLGEVAELKRIDSDQEVLRIGAGVSLEQAYAELAREYPEIGELHERFASPPIRNAGTLGGNLANGSPIGDSMPWLIALGARIHLRSRGGARVLALEDFYLDYMRNALAGDEILAAVEVPRRPAGLHFRTYKLSRRYDSDISALCAGFALWLDGGRIVDARVAFGGMAATVRRAPACEAALRDRPWDEPTLQAAMQALVDDYQPLSDLRASAGYRGRAAANLLHRFFLETREPAPLGADAVSVFAR